MRRLALITALALSSCVQSPPPAQPLATPIEQPLLAPRYPTWDEVRAPTPAPIASPTGATSPHPDSPSQGQPLIGGATLHHLALSKNGRNVDLHCILFDSRSYTLRVLDQPEDWSGGGKITECMRQAGAIAGVNGGFFTPQFDPMGLMISGGRKTGNWQSNKLLSGLITATHGTPRLVWNAEKPDLNAASDLLQAGPRLVDSGRPLTSLERTKHVARTFIATDGDHRWILGLARDTSLGELAEILATPGTLSGFHVHRALNLDGGHSSALYYRSAEGQEHSDPGWSTVRNYLGIIPR